jgi:hypothetical protein
MMTKGDELQVELASGGYLTVVVDNEGTCRTCGETILWCVTEKGNKMPVDIPAEEDDTSVSHFSTCCDAEYWRKQRKASSS